MDDVKRAECFYFQLPVQLLHSFSKINYIRGRGQLLSDGLISVDTA